MFPTLLASILTALPVSVFCSSVTLTGDTAVYVGGTAAFTAVSPAFSIAITNITWTLNGSPLDQLTDITSNTLRLTHRIRQLVLTNIPIAYDNTEVRCTVILDNSVDSVPCGPATQLHVQGLLGPVVNLTSQYNAATSNLSITWIPPAALTVPPANTPERFYCVQVKSGDMKKSRGCDGSVNEETSYLLDDVTCGVSYAIIIIPFNRIGNGTRSDLLFPDAPQIMNSSCPEDNVTKLTYFYPVFGLVCGCDGEIVDSDVTGVVVCDPNIPEPGILRVTVTATTNKDFNVNITASNTRTMSSSTFESTTFDICDLSITTTNSEVDYSVLFVDGSNALGVLIILIFRTNGLTDFSRSIYFAQGITGAQTTNQLSGVAAGTYEALAYDVEEDGLITSTTAADQERITVTTGQSSGTIPLTSFGTDINCTSNAINDNRTVMCMCNYDNATYAGFIAYLQNVQDLELTSAASTESGSSLFINGSMNGEHFVFVYPIWKSGSVISNRTLEPAYQDTHVLTIELPTTTSKVPVVSTDSSQGTSTSTSSDTTGRTTIPANHTPAVGASTAVILGVVILVLIMMVTLILLVLLFILKKRKKKTVSVDFKYAEVDVVNTTTNECYGLTSVSSVTPQDPVYSEVLPLTPSVDIIGTPKDDDLHISANECYNVTGKHIATNNPNYVNIRTATLRDVQTAADGHQGTLQFEDK